MPTCPTCKRDLPDDAFWPSNLSRCKECHRVYQREWKQKNKEKWLEQKSRYREGLKKRPAALSSYRKHKAAYVKKYRDADPDAYREYQRQYHRDYLKNNEAARLAHSARTYVGRIKRKSGGGTFAESINQRIKDEMSRKGFKPRQHVDVCHIIPLRWFCQYFVNIRENMPELAPFIDLDNIGKRYLNLPENITVGTKNKNRKDYDKITDEVLDLARWYEEEHGLIYLVEYLEMVRSDQLPRVKEQA